MFNNTSHVNSRKWKIAAFICLSFVLFYFFSVFLLDERFFGFTFQIRDIVFLTVLAAAGIYLILKTVFGFLSLKNLQYITALSLIIIVLLLSLDVSYTVYINFKDRQVISNGGQIASPKYRAQDRYYWTGERSPRVFIPETNVKLYKPNVRIETTTFGDLYYSQLLQSETIVDSVLELRTIVDKINHHGFRESTPIRKATTIILGDSYAYGHGTSQEKIWPELLEKEHGIINYNLGVCDFSPREELLLLKYFLNSNSKIETSNIKNIIWTIFEGNDLQDRSNLYQDKPEERDNHKNTSFRGLFVGTIVDGFLNICRIVKKQSIINWIRKEKVIFRSPLQTGLTDSPYRFDGIDLIYPIYYSGKFGFRLFDFEYLEMACKPKDYVYNHPYKKSIENTFFQMKTICDSLNYKVTVLIAPSAPRLYAPYFQNFPDVSQEPHFINFIHGLSEEMGFGTINLYEKLKPIARESLLYWRDDTHWNEQGNKIVAEIVADYFNGRKAAY